RNVITHQHLDAYVRTTTTHCTSRRLRNESKLYPQSYRGVRSDVFPINKTSLTGFRKQQNTNLPQKRRAQGGEQVKQTEQKGPEFQKALHEAMKDFAKDKQEEAKKQKGSAKHG
ncbi:hypothetical protein, partial [Paenibacillus polymyxa]|uniref:hypothetical protein n=1 Tax=Paenibacillus polymyxa TaxID=1406 RepID=UPI001FF02196